MVKPAYDHVASRQVQLSGLSKEIDRAIYTSEGDRDFNTVAILLLLKSLAILTTRYGDQEVRGILVDALEETLGKRRIPVTEEYALKQAAVSRWLP